MFYYWTDLLLNIIFEMCRSYYQPWKDLSSDYADVEKLEEIQACQKLLVSISTKLGGKSLFSQALSLQDLESSGVFEWERRTILKSP